MGKSLALIALAGSLLVAAPALADAPKGARIEGLVGWDRVSLDEGDYGLGPYSKNGFGYGAQIGYDVPVAPRVSVGIDGEIDGSTACYRYGSYRIAAGRDLYVGGRATLALTPVTNVYAKIGYADGRISASLPGYHAAANGDGVRLGVGAQQALTNTNYVLAEYRYTSYQDNFSRNQLMTGVGFRF